MLDATPIAVDTRGEQETISALLFLIDSNLVSTGQQLYAGDLTWATERETYGVELKSTSDLLGSLWSKAEGERLAWQLGRLREAVDVPILGHHGLLVGQGDTLEITKEPTRGKSGWFAAPVRKTKYRKESIDGFLWGIQCPSEGKGVYVIQRATREDLLRAIVEVFWWSRKESHGTFRVLDRRTTAIKGNGDGLYTDSLRVLAAFPGVGEGRAAKLLAHFKTLDGFLAAGDKEWAAVGGIGVRTVERIREVMHGYRKGSQSSIREEDSRGGAGDGSDSE